MQGEIQVGETQSIHVGVRVRYRGKREVVSIHVRCNDPDSAGAVHKVMASNVAAFVVSPAAIDFGQIVSDGKSRSVFLSVLSPDGKPLPVDLAVSAASTDPVITVQSDEAPSGQRCFRVTLSKDAPRGHFSGTLTLAVSHDPASYDVPITANVCGAISFAPQTLYVPVSGNSGQACSVLVWRTDGQILGKLIDKQLPKGIKLDNDGSMAGSRQRFTITATQDWSPAEHCQLRLRFENILEEVVVALLPRDATAVMPRLPAEQSK
jgi:hypothetical protein